MLVFSIIRPIIMGESFEVWIIVLSVPFGALAYLHNYYTLQLYTFYTH